MSVDSIGSPLLNSCLSVAGLRGHGCVREEKKKKAGLRAVSNRVGPVASPWKHPGHESNHATPCSCLPRDRPDVPLPGAVGSPFAQRSNEPLVRHSK